MAGDELHSHWEPDCSLRYLRAAGKCQGSSNRSGRLATKRVRGGATHKSTTYTQLGGCIGHGASVAPSPPRGRPTGVELDQGRLFLGSLGRWHAKSRDTHLIRLGSSLHPTASTYKQSSPTHSTPPSQEWANWRRSIKTPCTMHYAPLIANDARELPITNWDEEELFIATSKVARLDWLR